MINDFAITSGITACVMYRLLVATSNGPWLKAHSQGGPELEPKGASGPDLDKRAPGLLAGRASPFGHEP